MADYYVRATGGSNGNSGTSFANGWATIAYAITNTISNDRVFVCSDVSNKFSIAASITNWPFSRQWIGADLVDGSAYDGAGRAYLIATVPLGNMNSCAYHSNMLWQDIDFDGNSQASVVFTFPSWTSTMRNAAFVNCTFHGATSDGISLTCTSSAADRMDPLIFYGCEVYNNSRYGVYNVQCGSTTMYNCAIHHNQSFNYFGAGTSEAVIIFEMCRIFRSATNSGVNLVGGTSITLLNCIVFDNASHGVEFTFDILRAHVRNTIFSSNGGYGLTSVSGVNSPWYFADFNCFYSNTSGSVGPTINGGVVPGTHNVTSDPLFVSTVDGSEDFTLQGGSPCIDVGKGFEGGQ